MIGQGLGNMSVVSLGVYEEQLEMLEETWARIPGISCFAGQIDR
jgi:hypothetical protein